ncbi:MAG TPA: carboxypeptidase-like regulatory domain-containing protein [Candidatus Eisenbacteria bacterium]|nr:carboxypeptidase-like regulatory domain-containing protein [Candidatus Eisenbacteria bacterium]
MRPALMAAFAAVLFTVPTWAGTDLTGRVVSTDGTPVAKASVLVYTAKPRVGTSVYCPSCYPDCGKTRVSGRDGGFTVKGLDDSLYFDLLVVATGFEPTFEKKVDPMRGPIEVKIAPRDLGRIVRERAILGRVIDDQGRPVIGATVEPTGFHQGDRSSFGHYPGTDPIAITDETGAFAFMTAQSSGSWDLRVRARNLAPAVFFELPVGAPTADFRLAPGTTVTGRVLRDGAALTGVNVVLQQVNQAGGAISYGDEQLATDANGRFTFVNVTPGQDYWAYGTLSSFRRFGVSSSVRISVGDTASLVTVPSIEIRPGHRISGRARLSDGKPLPSGTRLTIARDPMGGAAILPLDSLGRFATEGIPKETVYLMLRVPGYRLARGAPGYLSRMQCSVVVDRDRDDIELVLDPE